MCFVSRSLLLVIALIMFPFLESINLKALAVSRLNATVQHYETNNMLYKGLRKKARVIEDTN